MSGQQIAQDILNGLSEAGRAAVGYARRGLLVFPCREKTTYGPDLDKNGKPKEHKEKTPYTRHGCHDATTDLAQVVRWWKQYPAAAVGIRTGAESGLFVVDVDTKNGAGGLESWSALQAQHGPAPKTRTVRTPSGGKHFYYKHSGQGKIIKTDAGRLGPGLDLRGDGNGYVIAAGSTIESGAYTYERDIPTAEAPEWLLELAVKQPRPERQPCPTIQATMSTPYGLAALARECEVLANAPEGQRNDLCNRVSYAAGQLVAGGELVEAEATTAVISAARQCGLDDGEIERTFQSGFEAGLLDPRNANSKSLQMFENVSGMSGMSGEATAGKGSALPDNEKHMLGMLGTPVPVRLPDGFQVNASGLWYILSDSEDGEPEKLWLGPPLHFIARTRNGDSEAWGQLLGWHDPDGRPHQWAMPYAMLNDARQGWRSELASGGWIGATSQKAKALLAHLLASVSVSARARCVDRTGWHGTAFVLPDIVIGQGEERLVLQASMTANPFTQSGTLEDWQQTIGAWARGNRLLMFGISAALSGFLLDLAGMDSGGFHFWGHSSTGKTTIMRAAWSVHGAPSGVRTWRSTSNGLEGTCALHNDACLCLDELGQAPAKTIGESIYMIANGQSKNRMNGDGSTRTPKAWRVLPLSTGEMTIPDKVREDGQQVRAGQEVRIIDLPADAGAGLGAWQDLHGHDTPGQFSDAIKAACASNYGTLSRTFIEELMRRQDELALIKDLAALVSAWTPSGSSGQVRRVVARFALVGLAGELATTWGLVPWFEGDSLSAAKGCLDSWLEGRGGAGDQEDRRAVDTVRAFIARYGASRFQNLELEGVCERVLDRAGFKQVGPNQRWEFIFTTEQFKSLMVGLNPTAAAKALERAGMLRPGDGRSLTPKVSLPELGRRRCYVVVLPDMPDMPDNEKTMSGSIKPTAGKASPDMPDMPNTKNSNCKVIDPKAEGWWPGDALHVRDRCEGYFYAECPRCQYSANDNCSAITAPF